jgi:cytochrome P450
MPIMIASHDAHKGSVDLPPGPPRITTPPPGPRGYPVLGSLPAFLRDPLGFLTRAAERYGDIVDLGRMGRDHGYLLTHPDQIKHVLVDNARAYVKGENLKAIKLVIGEGLVIAEGEHWRKQRRLVQPAFHRQRVGALTETMASVISDVVSDLGSQDANEPVEMVGEMMKLTQRVLLKSLLNLNTKEQTSTLLEAWEVVYEWLSDRLWSIARLPVGVPTPANLRFNRAIKTLNDLVDGIVRDRRAGPEQDDLLSMLLSARDEEGSGMADEHVRAEVMTLFAGGFETAAVTLAWAFYLLGSHPDVELKMHAEIDAVLGGRTPTLEDLPKLKYTKMIVDETMRLYPGVWIFSRTCVTADMVGGYPIQPGSLIIISPSVTHRHPEFWPNPNAFDPERFAPGQAEGRPRYAFLPFGGGARQCVGDMFAQTEMLLALAMIAQRFQPRLLPGFPVVAQPRFTLRAKGGIPMSLGRRSVAPSPTSTPEANLACAPS